MLGYNNKLPRYATILLFLKKPLTSGVVGRFHTSQINCALPVAWANAANEAEIIKLTNSEMMFLESPKKWKISYHYSSRTLQPFVFLEVEISLRSLSHDKSEI
jgi:hypothetical protein